MSPYDRQQIIQERYPVIYVKRDLAELLTTIQTERPRYLENSLGLSYVLQNLTLDMEERCRIFLEGELEELEQFLTAIPERVIRLRTNTGEFYSQRKR